MSQHNRQLDEAERLRLLQLLVFEEEARQSGFSFIAGVDEAGRGPLAGPVVAAACMIAPGHFIPGVDDSKKLTPRKRELLFDQLTTDPKVSYAVSIISSEIIDAINIYQATIEAMLDAVSKLPVKPDILLVDGMSLDRASIPSKKIIGGDALSMSIAAASVLAKVTRDHLMSEYDKMWPQYGFAQHKGYGTEFHMCAIQNFGPCSIHRMTFAPLKAK
jgi:ribonuclease HII